MSDMDWRDVIFLVKICRPSGRSETDLDIIMARMKVGSLHTLHVLNGSARECTRYCLFGWRSP